MTAHDFFMWHYEGPDPYEYPHYPVNPNDDDDDDVINPLEIPKI